MSPQERPDGSWWRFIERVRSGEELPFEDHWRAFQALREAWPGEQGPPPVWRPSPELIADSNIGRAMAERGLGSYAELHAWSTRHRAEFWQMAIRRAGIVFRREPREVLDLYRGVTDPRWLPGAGLNCVDSCFTADPGAPAIVTAGEETSPLERVTHGSLERLVARVANGLREQGFRPGDGIALYMPMTIECVAAFLAIVRAGCYVVSIADSFPPPEVARRLTIGKARAIVTVDRFVRAGKAIELYRNVVEAEAPRAIVIGSTQDAPVGLRDGDLRWEALLSGHETFDSHVGQPDELTTVLFSSGTTGDPKAIPWSHLTAIKAAVDGHFHQDIRPGDVVAWPTNIGWMMGPWLIYATLINGATMALYQGAPNTLDFLRFVDAGGVTALGVVPSLVRAWRALDPAIGGLDGIRVFSSTGEPSNAEDYLWLMSRAGYRAPVIEYCGGTEIGGGYITGTVVQPASPATFATPALGLDLVLVDELGGFVGDTGTGEVFLVPPSIGLSQLLLNRDHDEVYHAGCPRGPHGEILRRHGDRLARLPRGYYRAEGRADDTMNLGGIKVGSLEIENVLAEHAAVAECAAVGVQPGGEGAERLVVFVKLASEVDEQELRRQLARLLGQRLNPLFKIHDVVVLDELPRTASNKLMRRTLRTRYTERDGDG